MLVAERHDGLPALWPAARVGRDIRFDGWADKFDPIKLCDRHEIVRVENTARDIGDRRERPRRIRRSPYADNPSHAFNLTGTPCCRAKSAFRYDTAVDQERAPVIHPERNDDVIDRGTVLVRPEDVDFFAVVKTARQGDALVVV